MPPAALVGMRKRFVSNSESTRLITSRPVALLLRAILLSVLVWPSPVLAWGNEGHQIVALIAAHELTPAAEKAVVDLLGGTNIASTMAVASTWADEIRPTRPETAPWHYVNIEIGSAGYDADRDCPKDDCVVAQIQRDEQIIADKTLSPAVRAEALRFLIHFVGDIHQPLHAADDHDRGGNEIQIIYNGTTMNMHALWDKDMVQQLGDDPKAIASTLNSSVTSTLRSELQSGTPTDWVNESFRLAKSEVYAKYRVAQGDNSPIIITPTYVVGEKSTVSGQLIAAGLRLAWMLNKTWP